MTWLLDLLPAGKLAAIGTAILAGLFMVWRILAGQKQAGRDAQIAKEKEAQDADLKRVRDAAAAGDAAKRLPIDKDPYNLD